VLKIAGFETLTVFGNSNPLSSGTYVPAGKVGDHYRWWCAARSMMIMWHAGPQMRWFIWKIDDSCAWQGPTDLLDPRGSYSPSWGCTGNPVVSLL
jgi:hypothetical protein